MFVAFLSWPTVTVIIVVAALLFGPSKIPELARSLGEGIKEFKKGAAEFKKGLEEGPGTPPGEMEGPGTPPGEMKGPGTPPGVVKGDGEKHA